MKPRIHGAAVLAAGSLVLGALSACGGGGGGGGGGDTIDPRTLTSGIAEGFYTGTISGSPTSTRFELLALENAEVWALYGNMAGANFVAKGFVQGPTTRSGASFASTAIRDFGFNPAATASTSGTITETDLNGTLTSGGATLTFAGTTPATSNYNYDTPAVLSQITGAWSLTGLDGTITNVNISTSGTFTGTNGGCTLSGTIAPRPSGKNVFNVSVTYGPAPCPLPGTVASGIAITYLLAGGATRELVVGGVNAARTAGNAFFGTR